MNIDIHLICLVMNYDTEQYTGKEKHVQNLWNMLHTLMIFRYWAHICAAYDVTQSLIITTYGPFY